MPVNRISDFYAALYLAGVSHMTLEERNDEVNKALEKRFSQLNAALEAHEARMKKMMVPTDTCIEFIHCPEDVHGGPFLPAETYHVFLGMVKLYGTWRLCQSIRYDDSLPTDECIWQPIIETSLKDRLTATRFIDSLYSEIVRRKEVMISEVDEAIATLTLSLDPSNRK